jgi:hypothetical protein
MEFVMDKMAMKQDSFRILQAFPVSTIPSIIDTHLFIHHECHIDLAADSVVKNT